MKDNRLFRILYYILEKEKVTANELADKFEVSVRTIYRDIDSISSVGVPIFTTQGKGGGIKIDNEFILNKSLFDKNEKESLFFSPLKSADAKRIKRSLALFDYVLDDKYSCISSRY